MLFLVNADGRLVAATETTVPTPTGGDIAVLLTPAAGSAP